MDEGHRKDEEQSNNILVTYLLKKYTSKVFDVKLKKCV